MSLPFVSLKIHYTEKSIPRKTRQCGNVASHEQQRCQPVSHSKSTPRGWLGVFVLNPLSCCYGTRSFAGRRQAPWVFCSAWQQTFCHLMLLSGYPGWDRQSVCGRRWPIAIFHKPSWDGSFARRDFCWWKKAGRQQGFRRVILVWELSAEPCFGHFSPSNKSLFQSTLTSTSGHGLSVTDPVGVLMSSVWNTEP